MKIYTKMYSDQYANIPKALAPLQVPAEKMTCFAIPFPTEGILEAIIVRQVPTDATQIAAIVELLCSKIPYPAGSYPPGTPPVDHIEHYRVLPDPLTVPLGGAGIMDDEDFGRAFHNIDGTFSVNQRFLYLLIQPQEYTGAQSNPYGADTVTNWNVTLRARTDVQ